MKIHGNRDNWLLEDQLDYELTDKIQNFFKKNLKFLHEDSNSYSTTGNAKQYWIKNAREETYNTEIVLNFEKIEREYNKKIFGRLKAASLLKENIKLKHNSSWSVIGHEGSYHQTHTHGSGEGALSTVLYLKMPEIDDNDMDNSIFLILNVSPESNFFEKDIASLIHIKPRVGTLLIFPPHIPHGTYPQTKGIRHTFNLDYKLEFDKNVSI